MLTSQGKQPYNENRRQYRRTAINYPAMVTLVPDEDTEAPRPLEVIIHDISYAGIRIEGPALVMRVIQPDIDSIDEHKPVNLCIKFTMPDPQLGQQTVVVQAATTYSTPVSYDTGSIGLEFVDVEQGITALSELLISN